MPSQRNRNCAASSGDNKGVDSSPALPVPPAVCIATFGTSADLCASLSARRSPALAKSAVVRPGPPDSWFGCSGVPVGASPFSRMGLLDPYNFSSLFSVTVSPPLAWFLASPAGPQTVCGSGPSPAGDPRCWPLPCDAAKRCRQPHASSRSRLDDRRKGRPLAAQNPRPGTHACSSSPPQAGPHGSQPLWDRQQIAPGLHARHSQNVRDRPAAEPELGSLAPASHAFRESALPSVDRRFPLRSAHIRDQSAV